MAAHLSYPGEIEQRTHEHTKPGEDHICFTNNTKDVFYIHNTPTLCTIENGCHHKDWEVRYHCRHHHNRHILQCLSLQGWLRAGLFTKWGVGRTLLAQCVDHTPKTGEHYEEEGGDHGRNRNHNDWNLNKNCKKKQTTKTNHNKQTIKIHSCFFKLILSLQWELLLTIEK